MSWATISAFLQALPAILKLFQSIADYAETKKATEAGRAEAVAEAATIASQQLDAATKARQEADDAHRKNPTTDDGFDKDFQR